METSAKASINVEEGFFTLARDIKAKMDRKLVCTAVVEPIDMLYSNMCKVCFRPLQICINIYYLILLI